MNVVAHNEVDDLAHRFDQILEYRDMAFPYRIDSNSRDMESVGSALGEALFEKARATHWQPNEEKVALSEKGAQQACFIAGSMKSGTTLLTHLFDGHPNLIVLPADSAKKGWIFEEPVELEEEIRVVAVRYLLRLINPQGQKPFWFLGRDLRCYVEYLRYFCHFCRHGIRPFLANLQALYCASPYHSGDPVMFVAKNPHLELYGRELLNLFPNSYFLHVLRDPVTHFRTLKIHHRVRGYSWELPGVVARSAKLLKAGLALQKEISPERYRFVRYEDLCNDTEQTIRGIAQWMGLSYHDCLLNPTVGTFVAQANSMFSEKITQGKVRKVSLSTFWPKELTSLEKACIIALLYCDYHPFGYLQSISLSNRILARGAHRFLKMAQIIANRI